MHKGPSKAQYRAKSAKYRWQQNVAQAQRKQWLILSRRPGRTAQQPFLNQSQAAVGPCAPRVCYKAPHTPVSLHQVGAS